MQTCFRADRLVDLGPSQLFITMFGRFAKSWQYLVFELSSDFARRRAGAKVDRAELKKSCAEA